MTLGSVKEIDRPFLVQGSNDPIIIFKQQKRPSLLCSSCNDSVLIENYLPECIVGIGLMCFKCKAITWTPSLPPGETFTQLPICLSGTRGYLIDASIISEKDIIVTCNQEIENAKIKSSPKAKQPEREKSLLSIDLLNQISDELNVLSGGRFSKHLDSARRSLIQNNYHRENPLAWSIELLKKQLSSETFYLDTTTQVALSFLQGYRDMLARWHEHEYFPELVIEACAYFYHTLIQTIIASHLSDGGNRVAFNLGTKKNGERSADLYIRFTGTEKLFIEIKGPQVFEWTNNEITAGKIKKTIELCLSKSRGQIDIDNPGILIIGTSCLEPRFLEDLKGAIIKTLKSKGHTYPGVAGIGTVSMEHSVPVIDPTVLGVRASFDTDLIANPHYFKENPIKTHRP